MNRELDTLVWERADRRCEYCRFPHEFAELPFEIDHVIAKKHRGETAADNLALTCFYCNSGETNFHEFHSACGHCVGLLLTNPQPDGKVALMPDVKLFV